MLLQHFDSAPRCPVSYPSSASVKLAHRRHPILVTVETPAGEFTCYCVGCAEARGVEMLAEAQGFRFTVTVLVPVEGRS